MIRTRVAATIAAAFTNYQESRLFASCSKLLWTHQNKNKNTFTRNTKRQARNDLLPTTI